MPLQAGIELAQRLHFSVGKHAMGMKHRILGGHGVPLGKDHLAALGSMKIPVGVGGVHPHGVIESAHGELHRGEGAAGMPGIGGMNHIYNGFSVAVCQGLYTGWVAHSAFLQSCVCHEINFIAYKS